MSKNDESKGRTLNEKVIKCNFSGCFGIPIIFRSWNGSSFNDRGSHSSGRSHRSRKSK